MLMYIKLLTLLALSLPLFGGVITGIAAVFFKKFSKRSAHVTTITLMFCSFFAALILFKEVLLNQAPKQIIELYSWAITGRYYFHIGLLVDHLTVAMILVVTFVSLLVHIYSMAYMQKDASNQRFFSYMSLFTFAMLCLVAADDFILLFFGWEGVGLISYCLIGFWYEREAAVLGGLKAFIVNRVGDVGFLLAIAGVIIYFGSADYVTVFSQATMMSQVSLSIFPGVECHLLTVISLLLFIGAAAKSAQVPLHVWLPESMEGPTPISALIHAATMVTAGVYMLCRMSPLIEYSSVALSVILTIGAVTCLSMGLVAIVQNDIKRVIAYSTLSQLGYMMMGVGSSAYAAGLFHLLTHACFKALLFLAAGSVILNLHHEQDMRRMGGLWRYMPVTWITFLIGALALAAIPPFSGFFSKESIIEATRFSSVPGASFAYLCALCGTFVTALYIFRAFFLTFHGQAKFDIKNMLIKKSSWIIDLPLIALAIPSVILGGITIGPLLYQTPPAFADALFLLPQRDVLLTLRPDFHGAFAMVLSCLTTIPFWITIAGVVCASYFYLIRPQAVQAVKPWLTSGHKILLCQYGFDHFNHWVFVRSVCKLGEYAAQVIDTKWIDHIIIHGLIQLWLHLSRKLRCLQTGFIGHYALGMVCGLFALLAWTWITL